MSDLAKWAILVAVIISIVSLIVAFPITQYIKADVLGSAISTIVNKCSDALLFARGLINNFFSPWARTALSGLMIWLFGKFFLTYGVRITSWVVKFIFK